MTSRARRALAWLRENPQVWITLLVLVAIWDQSYNGRRDVVQSQRASCERSSLNLVGIVNGTRADYTANLAVADDPGEPARTRNARATEAQSQDVAMTVLDSHIDRGLYRALLYPKDRLAVILSGFRCNIAFPAATPWQFFN